MNNNEFFELVKAAKYLAEDPFIERMDAITAIIKATILKEVEARVSKLRPDYRLSHGEYIFLLLHLLHRDLCKEAIHEFPVFLLDEIDNSVRLESDIRNSLKNGPLNKFMIQDDEDGRYLIREEGFQEVVELFADNDGTRIDL